MSTLKWMGSKPTHEKTQRTHVNTHIVFTWHFSRELHQKKISPQKVALLDTKPSSKNFPFTLHSGALTQWWQDLVTTFNKKSWGLLNCLGHPKAFWTAFEPLSLKFSIIQFYYIIAILPCPSLWNPFVVMQWWLLVCTCM